jgi:hypothetical protein
VIQKGRYRLVPVSPLEIRYVANFATQSCPERRSPSARLNFRASLQAFVLGPWHVAFLSHGIAGSDKEPLKMNGFFRNRLRQKLGRSRVTTSILSALFYVSKDGAQGRN